MKTSEKKTRVYLTGFMASGKSTIGPILANTIGYHFVDVDALIEARERRKITEIFRTDGESYFRTVEYAIISEVAAQSLVVVSLGGGTITRQENIDLMKRSGLLVYLKATPENLFRRLRSKRNRPLLQDVDGSILPEDKLKERISALMTNREQFYTQADIVVLTDDKSVGRTVDEIVRKLRHKIEME
jgi:shikimate kinase